MSSKRPTEKPHSVRRLIELQKRLLKSQNPFVRRVGMLMVAGALDRHLDALSDRQVGQLMSDNVGRDLGIVQPEATICHQATQRLFRSENGRLEEEPPPSTAMPGMRQRNDAALSRFIHEVV
jgi:hypothetical protein